MKSVKRILSVAVAVLLIAMMMIPAVSAAGSNTVNWTCNYPGYTYTVYTVATYEPTTGAFIATPASLQTAVNNAVDANEMAALAKTLTTTTGLTEQGTTFTTNARSGHFDLPDGIYFIKCTQPGPNNKKVLKNSIVVFPNKNKTTAETINLTDKVNEGQPTVDKEIVGGANTFGTIDTKTFKSKTITYKLTADIAGSKDSKLTSYVITDKMGEGLDTSKHDVTSVVLKNGTTETPLTEGTDYTVTTAAADIDCATTVDGGTGTTGNTFGVKLSSDTILGTDAFYTEGNQVVVTYETQLDYATAAVATDIPNTDAMIYGNESGRNVVPGNTVNVQTYKVEAKKIDAVTKNPLEGAKFGLYQDADCTKLIVESAETDNDGIADFGVKLPAGTYYIKETKVPDGYNLNSTPQTVVLPRDADTTVVIEDTHAKLPNTGGNGTMMFTIIGGSLVLLAAALFVVVMKKKSSAK